MAINDIIFCGGLVCDITAFAQRFPKPGESVPATKSIKGFGGSSANQCYMAKLMGAKTALIGKVGGDEFGIQFQAHLLENSIHSEHVTVAEDAQTSVGIITVNDAGENTIVHVLGALEHLTMEDVTKAADDLFVKDSGQLLVATYECPRKPLLELLRRAKQYNITTVVNTVPWPGEAWEELYPYLDIVTLNETEVELATSLEVRSVSEAETAARALTRKGCGTVIVTLGKDGAVCVSNPEGPGIHVHAPEVKAVDPTGAGDAFLGGLVFFLKYYPELPISEKLRRACVVASLTVQTEGTQASYPARKNIPEQLFSHLGK